MLQVLIRFLTFNVMSEHPAVYWGLAAVWLILLLASVSSLRSQPLSMGAKVAWFALILFLSGEMTPESHIDDLFDL